MFSHPLQGQKISTLMGLSAAFFILGEFPAQFTSVLYNVTLSQEAGSFSYCLHLTLEGLQAGDCWIAGLISKGRISLFHALYDGDLQQLHGAQ